MGAPHTPTHAVADGRASVTRGLQQPFFYLSSNRSDMEPQRTLAMATAVAKAFLEAFNAAAAPPTPARPMQHWPQPMQTAVTTQQWMSASRGASLASAARPATFYDFGSWPSERGTVKRRREAASSQQASSLRAGKRRHREAIATAEPSTALVVAPRLWDHFWPQKHLVDFEGLCPRSMLASL